MKRTDLPPKVAAVSEIAARVDIPAWLLARGCFPASGGANPFLGLLYFYAAMFSAAGRACISRFSCILAQLFRSNSACQATACTLLANGACMLATKKQQLLEGGIWYQAGGSRS